jgi:hypothetical protein
MFIGIYERGHRLSRFRLAQVAAAVPGDIATHRGLAGKRLRYLQAHDARDAFRRVIRFVDNTGYTAIVETTSAEAKALMTDGLVGTDSGEYRLEVVDGDVMILDDSGNHSDAPSV